MDLKTALFQIKKKPRSEVMEKEIVKRERESNRQLNENEKLKIQEEIKDHFFLKNQRKKQRKKSKLEAANWNSVVKINDPEARAQLDKLVMKRRKNNIRNKERDFRKICRNETHVNLVDEAMSVEPIVNEKMKIWQGISEEKQKDLKTRLTNMEIEAIRTKRIERSKKAAGLIRMAYEHKLDIASTKVTTDKPSFESYKSSIFFNSNMYPKF